MMLKTWSSSMLCVSLSCSSPAGTAHLDAPAVNGHEDVVDLDRAVLRGSSPWDHLKDVDLVGMCVVIIIEFAEEETNPGLPAGGGSAELLAGLGLEGFDLPPELLNDAVAGFVTTLNLLLELSLRDGLLLRLLAALDLSPELLLEQAELIFEVLNDLLELLTPLGLEGQVLPQLLDQVPLQLKLAIGLLQLVRELLRILLSSSLVAEGNRQVLFRLAEFRQEVVHLLSESRQLVPQCLRFTHRAISGLDQSGLLIVALSQRFLRMLAQEPLVGEFGLSGSAKSVLAVKGGLHLVQILQGSC
mmetsp:Transcript_8868/g.20203  ORF Transcript_8868/g.20203 Transcript_8868/m.20203 type:complete len:301 (+) Transcript_8868:848-1750(+)